MSKQFFHGKFFHGSKDISVPAPSHRGCLMNMKLRCTVRSHNSLCCQLVPLTPSTLFACFTPQAIYLWGDLLTLAISIPPYESNSRTSELTQSLQLSLPSPIRITRTYTRRTDRSSTVGECCTQTLQRHTLHYQSHISVILQCLGKEIKNETNSFHLSVSF